MSKINVCSYIISRIFDSFTNIIVTYISFLKMANILIEDFITFQFVTVDYDHVRSDYNVCYCSGQDRKRKISGQAKKHILAHVKRL